MAQGDPPPPNNQIESRDFNNEALFTDRLQSLEDIGEVDRSFTGKLDAYVYPDTLMGSDFARRGGQVMVFKILTRKSQKIDLGQDVSDAFTLAKETGAALAEKVVDMGAFGGL